ncbi:MAG: hypothetical protein AVDCRST_MAG43-1026 [uncultured Thermomicrobiales bacterium]|uniref:Uncharacterized protein n=1 Tax=uncultured Thermomicrobiales bacterium TaxID=1645740 RepID=A0A6J4UHB7_9BACT|nr:MAG: hypothetical protein AVDCRST_MAG43-1026 [uncultured Thermomicrobiales bacterium]
MVWFGQAKISGQRLILGAVSGTTLIMFQSATLTSFDPERRTVRTVSRD